MATTLVSVEKYSHTSYEPEVEYVDGVLEERNVGEWWHAGWQMAIGGFFWNSPGMTEPKQLFPYVFSQTSSRIPLQVCLSPALPRLSLPMGFLTVFAPLPLSPCCAGGLA